MTLLKDIWSSIFDMPLWVRYWVFVVLIPINVATLFFIGHPNAHWISLLAILGLASNLVQMVLERGFTSAMAIPHLIFWIPLTIVIAYSFLFIEVAFHPTYFWFLIALLLVDAVSLSMDIPDAIKWLKNKRSSNQL